MSNSAANRLALSTLHLHTSFQIAPVDPRVFGGFIEHLGRCVYEGLYDPKSAHADEAGCRKDVLGALGRLEMTAMRYPGGNFASGYHWMNGVGPKESRPRTRELAWQSTETNQFGTDEYIALCRQMNWTPMLTINLGTGTPEEAGNWLEYCNLPLGTQYSDLRAENGSPEPYGVKLWCLGNEMDGPWQLGYKPAKDYGSLALQAAKIMKDADPSIEVVVSGSSGSGMNTFCRWDEEALECVGDLADYVSLHRYVGNQENDTPEFLAVTAEVDQQIEAVDAVCRSLQAKRKSKKRAFLCFDEWNVWYRAFGEGRWQEAPHLIEEVYNLEDALVVAGFFNSFIGHADSVKIANIAQVVNVIAPVLTDGDKMLIQSIFYPFEMYTKRRKGASLKTQLDGPTYESKKQGVVAYVDQSAILSEDGKSLSVFLVNRSLDSVAPVCVKVADKAISGLVNAEIVSGTDPKAANSYENPNVVTSKAFDGVKVRDGAAMVELPPLSVVACTLALAP